MPVKPKIVYVGAHPDEFINEVCTACRLADKYDNVVVALTHGERGRPDWTMEHTVEVRTAEETAACAALGLELHMLDGIDGELCKYIGPTSEQLCALLKELRPAAVFLQYPVDVHPDHMAAFTIGRIAIAAAGIETEVILSNYRYQTSGFHADYAVDISGYIEKKLAYCRAHTCQNIDDGMAQHELKLSAWLGKVYGMQYADEFMIFSPSGLPEDEIQRPPSVLDGVGVRLPVFGHKDCKGVYEA